MARAVMEGVSYSLLDCLSVIREMDVSANSVRAGGGGGKSPLWRQIQADMFGCGVAAVNSSEGGALGVALLAAVGAKAYGSVEEACAAVIEEKSKAAPNTENQKIYAKQYELFKKIYNRLKDTFR